MRGKVGLRFLFSLIILFCFTCNFNGIFSNNKPGPNQALLDSLTLASLKKIDDYPLYVMHYFGDYGFADYLKTGESPGSSLKIHFDESVPEWACTCFAAFGTQSKPVLGRNFDWVNRPSLLLFTDPPEAFASVSMVDLAYFGYNQQNLPDSPANRQRLLETPFLPFDGMNEKGVAIGMMAVPRATSPYDPKKVTIGEIQVLRLVLDYARDVEHAIQLIQKYNVRMEEPPIHYLIADRSGNSVIIEFVDSKMILIRNPEPFQVSTNFIIHQSGAPQKASCWRYRKAYATLSQTNGNVSLEAAMELLKNVSQASTMWSTLWEMQSGHIRIAVGRDYTDVKQYYLRPHEQ